MNRSSHKPAAAKRRPMPWCLLAVGLLFLLPGLLHAQSAPAIRPRVEVAGPAIRIKDLLALPLPAAFARHADTPVLNAPLPGKDRFVPGAFLAKKLALLAGVDVPAIHAPNRVCLARKGQTLSDSRLRPLLTAAARDTWTGEVTVTGLRVTGRRPLPLGPVTLTPDTARLRIRKNRIELPVAVSMGEKNMGRLTLSGEASVLKPVVVAAAPLRKGEKLTAAHLTLALRPMPPSDHEALTETALAVGRMATRPIRPGTVLTGRLVAAPPLVKRGKGVRIRYTAGGLLITATGIARETGGLGDVIKVQNSRSKKSIHCRVTGQGRVEPFF